jgi:flagella basal body P-ring formation protein FlgA
MFSQLMMRSMMVVIVTTIVAPVGATEIVLKSLAAPKNTVVRLGDVAEIQSTDSREAQRLAALPLMPAPSSGKKRYLRQREVQDLLAAHGEEMNQLTFGGEATVEIAAAAEPISSFHAAWSGSSVAVGTEANDVGAKPVVTETQAAAIRNEMEPLIVDYLVRAKQVVVAVQVIERGKIVTAADVEMQDMEDAPAVGGKHGPVESAESLIGMEAARAIQAGDIVMADDVKPQILVKRGEEVAVYARGGGIQVRTLARAKQDGAKGQLITVESLVSREPFDAVVVGSREAMVFAGNAAPAPAEVAERPFRKSQQQ